MNRAQRRANRRKITLTEAIAMTRKNYEMRDQAKKDLIFKATAATILDLKKGGENVSGGT